MVKKYIPLLIRVEPQHYKVINKTAHKLKVSKAAFIRTLIETYDTSKQI